MIKGTTWNSEIYAGAWKSHAKAYQEAAQALQGIFATDPSYAQKLIEIIQEYNLNFYDNVDSTTKVVDDKVPESPLVASKLDNSAYPDYNGVEYPGADSYAFGNCTQYVYNRIIQLGGLVGTHMGNGGEWGINAQAQGYFTTTVPTEGYAVSFPPGVAGSSSEYGHVAFVEKVYSEKLDYDNFTSEIIEVGLHITICELKKDKIGLSAFLQSVKYAKAIQRYLTKRGFNSFNLSILLCGSKIDDIGSFIFLTDVFENGYSDTEFEFTSSIKSIDFYTYKYDFNGLDFKNHKGYCLINEGF